MMLRLLGSVAASLLWIAPATAQDVIACDSLIAARRIDATPGPDRGNMPETGCRRIAAAAVGTVEQRAMIGGIPYECITIAGRGGCLWIVP